MLVCLTEYNHYYKMFHCPLLISPLNENVAFIIFKSNNKLISWNGMVTIFFRKGSDSKNKTKFYEPLLKEPINT